MTFICAFKRALGVLAKKPMMLWGLSLLMAALTAIASIVTIGTPVVTFVVLYLFELGAAKLYLDGLAGNEVNSKQLFFAFNRNFVRSAGAMAWRDLWQVIWGCVPVMGIIKSYQYRFVPYIITNHPEISAFDALKISMELTKGKKRHMFLADLIVAAAPTTTFMVLGFISGLFSRLFSRIPYLGDLVAASIALIIFALYVVILLFGGIFTGLYGAAFFNAEELDKYLAPAEEVAAE